MSFTYHINSEISDWPWQLTIEERLFSTFIENIENQAKALHKNFEKKRNEITDGQDTYTYTGLQSNEWVMDVVFVEHFPSLHRRSGLMSLVGFFESELFKLCTIYRKQKHLKLKLNELKGQGFEKYITYLEKVAGIEVFKQSESLNRIRPILKLRNVIAHQNGWIISTPEQSNDRLLRFVEQSPYLGLSNGIEYNENEVYLREGFLGYALDAFRTYFKQLAENIERTEERLPVNPEDFDDDIP